MKQQTAVEWLEERFDKYMAWRTGDHKATEYTYQELVNDFDKARQMEKEQIVKVIEDYLSWHSNKGYVSHKHGDPKEYYLDTYENPNT